MIELYVRIEIRRNIFWNTNLKLVLTGFISNELERNSCPIIKPIIIEKKTKEKIMLSSNLIIKRWITLSKLTEKIHKTIDKCHKTIETLSVIKVCADK